MTQADRSADGSSVFALRPVLAVVAVKSALTLSVAGRYGWHRDELYYAVAGLHLQGGYVEFPPVTALLSALARETFGWSLVAFRSLTILAGAGTVLVAALVARELGGTRRAQTLAAIVVAFAPGTIATNWLFQPVAFDQLTTIRRPLVGASACARPRFVAPARSRRGDRARDQVHARHRARVADRPSWSGAAMSC